MMNRSATPDSRGYPGLEVLLRAVRLQGRNAVFGGLSLTGYTPYGEDWSYRKQYRPPSAGQPSDWACRLGANFVGCAARRR